MRVMMLGMRVIRVQNGSTLASRMLHPEDLEALTATQKAPIFEHVTTVWMESPEAAFSRLVGASWDLDEAVVEGEVVAERVLPALCVLAVVRETIHDEFVDVTERKHLL